MLSRVRWWRHVTVLGAAVVVPLLVVIGLIGGGRHPERFDAKQVVVTVEGRDGVRLREIVDQDFGSNDRHGYQRIIPTDFGAPTDIEAYTYDDDIPALVWISEYPWETQIRIGDPDTTASGQHRFELAYTLPEARLSTRQLALDIIGSDETLETGRFEVILDGFRLDDPVCRVGAEGDTTSCELAFDGEVYRAVFEPLEPGQGITVGGRITDLVPASGVPDPALPERRSSNRTVGAAVLAVLGLGTAIGIYLVQSRRGRNLVGGSGAVDAAHADGPTRLVTDRELEAMATTEFEPPPDLHPWQGAVLIDEAVTSRSVSAWFAEQIATDVLVLTERHNVHYLTKGDKWRETDITTMDCVRDLFKNDDELSLARYQPTIEKLWRRLTADQTSAAKKAKWWDKGGVLSHPADSLVASGALVLGAPLLIVVGVILGALGLLDSWILCGLMTVALSAIAATSAYAVLASRRSAAGSALALRTESFRRFLAASEGQHVDWAWERGVVREYTAWAVALGAAAAWGKAIDASTVAPQVNQMLVAPAVFERQLSSLESARTPPPPPSSSGGGSSSSSGSSWSSSSFSSGSVGGGGGGGSSGSW